LAERVLNDGATGIVALGTTGEPATLDPAERLAVVEICDAVCTKHDRGLIVGAGTNSTRGTIDEIELLTDSTNVDAVLAVVPYYTRPSQRSVVEHFQLIADVSPLPVVIYNVPYRTGRGLDSAAILEVAEHPRIVGLKQAVNALDTDTLEVLAMKSDNFAIFAGDDAFIVPSLLMGAVGTIAAAAHMCTPLFVQMVDAALAEDVPAARELAHRLLPVVTAGFAEPNPAVFKAALCEHGDIATATLRRPLSAASNTATEQLLSATNSALRSHKA